MRTTTSSEPAVIAAMIGLCSDTVSAFCGEPPQGQTGDFVAVAWNGPESVAISRPMSPSTRGAGNYTDEYDITNQFVAWQGGIDLLACVVRAYAYLDAFVAKLAADPTLGGVCMRAIAANVSLSPVQTTKGAMATVALSVNVLSAQSRTTT